MTNDFLTIKQAAKLTGKSEVTIRRLIKRLLKNRTAQTDQMINLTNRHGSSVYRIERRFLIEHVNLPEDRKQELLSATSHSSTQTNSQNVDDHGLSNQTPSPTDQTTSGSDRKSEQSAYSSNPLHSQPTNQSPSQTTQADPTSADRAERGDSQPDHSPTQTTGHFSEEGLQLLKTTLDQLTRQLDKKDDQIAAKDDQLSKLDKQLSVERERNEKLTQIIEQGNVLVHSAQQRIPLPDEDSKGELIESSIEANDIADAPVANAIVEDDSEPAENRGVISRLFSRFGRSDS